MWMALIGGAIAAGLALWVGTKLAVKGSTNMRDITAESLKEIRRRDSRRGDDL
jgi:hypothetical protein